MIQIKKIVICLLGVMMLSSCASTHPGLHAEQEKNNSYKDLNVSVYFRQDLSDENNFYYEVTFENKGNQWIRIDEAEIEFPASSGGPYNMVKGNDLAAWAESLKLKSQTSEFNEGILVAGAILGGLTMAAMGEKGGNTGMFAAGAMMAGAGATYQLTKDFKSELNKAQTGNQLPDNHLYKPFVIPSQGLMRKWILWSVPSGKIAQHAKLKLMTLEGEQYIYRIHFWGKL